MEIHTPDHPITNWKDTLKHLAIITAGVLIALALEDDRQYEGPVVSSG